MVYQSDLSIRINLMFPYDNPYPETLSNMYITHKFKEISTYWEKIKYIFTKQDILTDKYFTMNVFLGININKNNNYTYILSIVYYYDNYTFNILSQIFFFCILEMKNYISTSQVNPIVNKEITQLNKRERSKHSETFSKHSIGQSYVIQQFKKVSYFSIDLWMKSVYIQWYLIVNSMYALGVSYNDLQVTQNTTTTTITITI
jgi:hypothetical protein